MTGWLTRLCSMQQGLKRQQEQEEGLQVAEGSWLQEPRQQSCIKKYEKCGAWLPQPRQPSRQSSEQAHGCSSPASTESLLH